MKTVLSAVLASAVLGIGWGATPASADVPPFPKDFDAPLIKTRDVELNVRVGGRGPAVLLLHGYGESGDMWAPLAARLAATHTVIVPDLRGMGLSSIPRTGSTR